MLTFSEGGSGAFATGGGTFKRSRLIFVSHPSLSFLEICAVSRFLSVGMTAIINYLNPGIDSIGLPWIVREMRGALILEISFKSLI